MDDLISRKAAIDAIKTWGLIDGLSEGQAIEILADEEKVPPAQPERKTGQWDRLMMYLADLQLTYAPVEGHGDIRLYEFVTGLIEELEGWEDGGGT